MIKTARLEPGVSPSAISGKPSERIVAGEALTAEEAKTVKKAALQMPSVPVEAGKKKD